MFRKSLTKLALAVIAVATIGPASAEDVVLILDGAGIERKTFSRKAIEAMPATRFETSTVWTEGVIEFTGVSLRTFLSASGVERGVLKAAAINDYAVEVPVSDAVDGGPIIAYAMNGEPMSVRDKGPLWIVYPYDSDPKYQTETHYSRSIWQLKKITVMP